MIRSYRPEVVPPSNSFGNGPTVMASGPRRSSWRRVALVVAALIAAAGLQAALAGAAVAATPTGTTLSVDPPPAADVYVADFGNDRVQKFPAAGGPPTTFLSGQSPELTFDSAGDMFIPECENHQVTVVPADGSPQGTVGEELSCPTAVALDAAGDVFILDQVNRTEGRVVEVPEGFGPQITVAEQLHFPSAIAADAVGDLFIGINNNTYEIPAGRSGLHKLAGGTPVDRSRSAAQPVVASLQPRLGPNRTWGPLTCHFSSEAPS